MGLRGPLRPASARGEQKGAQSASNERGRQESRLPQAYNVGSHVAIAGGTDGARPGTAALLRACGGLVSAHQQHVINYRKFQLPGIHLVGMGECGGIPAGASGICRHLA